MPAEFIKLYPQNPDPRRIEHIVKSLRDGAVIIYPPDTVYGMGCDIHNARAVERVAHIKGIKPTKKRLFVYLLRPEPHCRLCPRE